MIGASLIAFIGVSVSAQDIAPTPQSAGETIARLWIPALDLSLDVITFPLTATDDGATWAIDPNETRAGHLEATAWFGAPGNVAIGAHARLAHGSQGAFARLDELALGDAIWVTIDGDKRRYRVSETARTVPFDDLTPLYPTTDARLTLLTCEPESYAGGAYLMRWIVVAIPDPMRAAATLSQARPREMISRREA